VGFPEPLTWKHLAWLPFKGTTDEAKAETQCVSWSLPSQGITGDLDGSPFKHITKKE